MRGCQVPSYPSGFYVYMLVDPKTGIPFYVGKGQKDRAWQHAQAVARGDLTGNARKVAKIQEILTCGYEVEIQIVAQYDLEDDALEHEFELVDSMVELTNMVPGGGGRTLKPAEIERRARDRETRIQGRMLNRFEGRHQDRLDRAKQRVMNYRGAERHKAEIDAWFSQFEIGKEGDAGVNVRVNKRAGRRGQRQAFLQIQKRPPVTDKSVEAKLGRAAHAKRKRRLRCL